MNFPQAIVVSAVVVSAAIILSGKLEAQDSQKIQAQEITIVGADGQKRAVISGIADIPGITFFSPKGAPVLLVGYRPIPGMDSVVPLVAFPSEDGKAYRSAFMQGPSGGMLALNGNDQNFSMTLSTSSMSTSIKLHRGVEHTRRSKTEKVMMPLLNLTVGTNSVGANIRDEEGDLLWAVP